MDNYQSNGNLREDNKANAASHESLNTSSDQTLKQENEQLKAYIFQYEQQIKDLEREL